MLLIFSPEKEDFVLPGSERLIHSVHDWAAQKGLEAVVLLKSDYKDIECHCGINNQRNTGPCYSVHDWAAQKGLEAVVLLKSDYKDIECHCGINNQRNTGPCYRCTRPKADCFRLSDPSKVDVAPEERRTTSDIVRQQEIYQESRLIILRAWVSSVNCLTSTFVEPSAMLRLSRPWKHNGPAR
eukprot:tig00001220_g7621.t1